MRRVYLAGPPYAEEYRKRAAALVREIGWEPIDPMRRDFRGKTRGREAEIVEGDLAEIESCTGGTPPHPWTVYVADVICGDLESAVRALSDELRVD